MYYQVQVSPRDRDSLRFLWCPDGNLESQQVVHRMKVHLFGATSSPCCASFALRQAAIDFGAQFEPYISSAIEEHFYVDDFLISVPNVEIGLKLMKDIKHLLSKASFNLTKWCSNCPEIIKHLLENELSKSLQINALAKNSSERVLGVNWNLNTDCFYFVVELPDKPCTKRGVLSSINSIFDPLGFLCPVIVEAKLLYRRLCELELEWDEPIPSLEFNKWQQWIRTLEHLKSMSIPRWMGLLPIKAVKTINCIILSMPLSMNMAPFVISIRAILMTKSIVT